ncbi:MAG: hypothetical protein ACLFWF_13555 [Alphaproteobacteria bacterium]
MIPIGRIFLWTGRAVALLLALSGLWLLVSDAVRTVEQGTLSLKPLGQVWYEGDAGSLNLAQAVVERYLFPELWHPVITTFLNWPAWVLPLALAALLGFLTWPRRA